MNSNQMCLHHVCWLVALIAMPTFSTGCQEIGKAMQRTWHDKFNWRAEDYFDDPQVIALCRAIEAEDLEAIDRLVAAGADVNAQGKGKMTPLLWAFPDNKPERFKRLLEHGANPNVLVESDFNTRMAISPGTSVTHLATGSNFPLYFEYVFEHGGDPNLVGGRYEETPIFLLITGPVRDRHQKIKTLITKGADINFKGGTGVTPAMKALGFAAQFDVVLLLLEAGADPDVYVTGDNDKLVHMVILQERILKHCGPQQVADYHKLVKWLKEHGQSFEEARAYIERRKAWAIKPYAEQRRLREQEVAEREARQKQEEQVEKEAQ